MNTFRFPLQRGQHDRGVALLRSAGTVVEILPRHHAEWRRVRPSPGINFLLATGDYEELSSEQATAWAQFLSRSREATDALHAERIVEMFGRPRVRDAIAYASTAHGGQLRKGTSDPYITHPVAVAKLVAAHGGSEDQVIAALCHDVAEDCGGQVRIDEIRDRFGNGVADIVTACSDSLAPTSEVRAEWWGRKRAFLNQIADAPDDATLVLLADKMHNATAIVRDYEHVGEPLWARFETGCVGQLWYIRNLGSTLSKRARGRQPELQDFACQLLGNSRALHEQVWETVGRDEYQYRVDEGLDRAAHTIVPELSNDTDFGRG